MAYRERESKKSVNVLEFARWTTSARHSGQKRLFACCILIMHRMQKRWSQSRRTGSQQRERPVWLGQVNNVPTSFVVGVDEGGSHGIGGWGLGAWGHWTGSDVHIEHEKSTTCGTRLTTSRASWAQMSLEILSDMKWAEYMTLGKVVFTPSEVCLSNSSCERQLSGQVQAGMREIGEWVWSQPYS